MKKFSISKSFFTLQDENQNEWTLDRSTMKLIQNSLNNETKKFQDFLFSLGLFNLNYQYYLVFVHEVENVCEFRHVMKINKFSIVQISNGKKDKKLVNLLEKGLKICNLYYSDTDDLSLNYQFSLQNREKIDHYVYNFIALKQFSDFFPNLNKTFCKDIVAGFIKQRGNILLFARRSRHFGGAHYWNRGADSFGYSANFVETEQIILNQNNEIIASVFLRGSVPMLWSQTPPDNPFEPPRFGPEKESISRFNQHFDRLESIYPNIIILALTSPTNREKILTENYKKLIDTRKELKYFNLNINVIQRTDGLIYKEISKTMDEMDWLVVKDGNIIKYQTKYSRSNCLSCLDRANIYQAVSGQYIGNKYNIKKEDMESLNELWAEHAHAISFQYSGTKAQRTTIAKTSKATFGPNIVDNITRVQRLANEVLIEGTLTDAYCCVQQETEIKSFRTITWIEWFFYLIVFLLCFVIGFIVGGKRGAFKFARKYGINAINHPHYRDTRDCEFLTEKDFPSQ